MNIHVTELGKFCHFGGKGFEDGAPIISVDTEFRTRK